MLLGVHVLVMFRDLALWIDDEGFAGRELYAEQTSQNPVVFRSLPARIGENVGKANHV